MVQFRFSAALRGCWGGSINQNHLLQFHLDKYFIYLYLYTYHIYSVEHLGVCTVLFSAGSVLVADD